jgi:hypothetical protein
MIKGNEWKIARKVVQLIIKKEIKHIDLIKLPMNILHRVFLILDKKNLWNRW